MTISVCIPIYEMDDAVKFLTRNLDSILSQSYQDYEIVVSDDSDNDMLKTHFRNYPLVWVKNTGLKGMANNTNNAINHAKGELIKILFQDDYFFDEHSLGEIVKYFLPHTMWLVTGCCHEAEDGMGKINPHKPYYSESENTIGSPSVLAFRAEVLERFDPQFHWVLDLDLYKRLFHKYGKPKYLNKVNVVIGLGTHQTTHKLSDRRKEIEFELLKKKYDTLATANN